MLSRLKSAIGTVAELFSRAKSASTEELREILIEADVGVTYTDIILKAVTAARDDRQQALKNELIRLLSIPKPSRRSSKPHIVMVSGVNGSGKTTTVAKLANLYKKTASVICACADTYRDAASEQLAVWAHRAGVEIVASQKGQDAAAVVFDTVARAQAQTIDTIIIDTAGRLHTRKDLMEELKKIQRVITKLKNTGPDFNILTIDANLGQNSIQQAKVFTAAIGINSLILTKFDGTAKGGAIIPICNELTLPVLYLGVGEGVDDIIEFEPHAFVNLLFSDR
jgi:fused signal recognition particle receptor